MGKLWLTQQINSDPLFPNITRKINVRNARLEAQYEQICIDAYITYYDSNNNDITSKFTSEVGDWILNNSKTTTVRDGDGNPIPNPEYDEVTNPTVDQFLKLPSFDYFFNLITVERADLISLLSSYIYFNDNDGDFLF